jgi:hypothetical protein
VEIRMWIHRTGQLMKVGLGTSQHFVKTGLPASSSFAAIATTTPAPWK